MSKSADPRPARTRALLLSALFELIQEKRWERIRVQDILDRSGVGRSTFYSHYDNKFDLLTGEMPTLTMTISEADGVPDFLPLFEHVLEMEPVMRPLLTQPLLGEVTFEFQKRLATSWDTYLEELAIPEVRRRYLAEILAGGFIAVARRWLTDRCKTPPDQMAEDFGQAAMAAVRHATDPAMVHTL